MKKNTNRRGFTLTELAVVLAVLGIVSAMVVSFTVSVNGSRQLSSARLDAMSDVGVAESFVNDFIERNGGVVATDEKGNSYISVITVANGENIETKKLFFKPATEEEPAKIVVDVTAEGEADTEITLTNVTGISFDSKGDDDVIYFVTVTFEVLEKAETYTFCVNPFVGEGGN